MKKLFVLLLCLSLVLLPACQSTPIVPPTGSWDDYFWWNHFIWDCDQNKPASFEMERVKEGGGTEKVSVSFDGDKYTITDDSGTRNYAHLIHDRYAEKIDGNYHYGDYFFLSDDADMTFEKYQKAMPLQDHMQLLLPTELVLGKTYVADSVECYGLVPKTIEKILSHIYTGETWEYFCEKSFFTTEVLETNDDNTEKQLLKRFDYNGNLLCEVALPLPYVSSVMELKNGDFCVALTYLYQYGKEQTIDRVICFSPKGEQRWQYTFPEDRNVYLDHLLQADDAIYCFGELKSDENGQEEELYILKLAADGTFVKERIAGGSQAENTRFVEIGKEGFTVYGTTRSTDGDFPFHSDHSYSTGFQVKVSSDLELSDAEKVDHELYSHYPRGYYKGTLIHSNHPVFAPVEEDRLPDETFTCAIIPFSSGYVILRSVYIEPNIFSPTYQSSESYYSQIIATYYNAFGMPVWQTVGKPFIG